MSGAIGGQSLTETRLEFASMIDERTNILGNWISISEDGAGGPDIAMANGDAVDTSNLAAGDYLYLPGMSDDSGVKGMDGNTVKNVFDTTGVQCAVAMGIFTGMTDNMGQIQNKETEQISKILVATQRANGQ